MAYKEFLIIIRVLGYFNVNKVYLVPNVYKEQHPNESDE